MMSEEEPEPEPEPSPKPTKKVFEILEKNKGLKSLRLRLQTIGYSNHKLSE